MGVRNLPKVLTRQRPGRESNPVYCCDIAVLIVVFWLMFLMRERLECRISILKHCLMRLWNDINQLTFVFPFAETRSVKWMWCLWLTERIMSDPGRIYRYCSTSASKVLARWSGTLTTKHLLDGLSIPPQDPLAVSPLTPTTFPFSCESIYFPQNQQLDM